MRRLFLLTLLVIAIPIYVMYQTLNQPMNFVSNTLYPKFTLDDLAQKSSVIVVGKINEVKPATLVYENNDEKLPLLVTDVVIDVESELIGNLPDKQITIRTIGGKTDTFEMLAGDEVSFDVGERVLIFANSDAGGVFENTYYISGGKQGKFVLKSGKAYNADHPDGIPEDELIQKIVQSRGRR